MSDSSVYWLQTISMQLVELLQQTKKLNHTLDEIADVLLPSMGQQQHAHTEEKERG